MRVSEVSTSVVKFSWATCSEDLRTSLSLSLLEVTYIIRNVLLILLFRLSQSIIHFCFHFITVYMVECFVCFCFILKIIYFVLLYLCILIVIYM
jgi:hypothetical protein